VARAVDWVAERRPDLVVVTGDLLTHPRAEPELRAHLERLGHPWVVLGNHDHAWSRDPFSRPVDLGDLRPARLLLDESAEIELRGARVEIAGVNPRTWLERRSSGFPPSRADFRILLCHFPRALDTVEPGRWDLILAGHLHAGQIVVPYGFGKLLLAHPGAPYSEGLYRRGDTVMHVSPGLGTTFVPFRFAARPEATELVLRAVPEPPK
jgi:predicted MPP superfamily phosphohydrolase